MLKINQEAYIIISQVNFRGEIMEKVSLTEIGKRIQQRRKQMGYTQEQIANMMDVSIQMVSNLERGNKSIRIENLINLCQILQVSVDYILTGRNTELDNTVLFKKILQLSGKSRQIVELLVDYCLNPEDT